MITHLIFTSINSCVRIKSAAKFVHLKLHELCHSDMKFKCNICSRKFPFQSELTSHQAMHSDEKKFKCAYPKCQGKYKMKEEYNRQYKTHRPTSQDYKCLVCNKVFNKKKYLREHKQVHRGELLFKCEVCGNRFRWHSGHKVLMDEEHKTRKV